MCTAHASVELGRLLSGRPGPLTKCVLRRARKPSLRTLQSRATPGNRASRRRLCSRAYRLLVGRFMRMPSRSREGFTLVELMIVVAIVGVLAVLAVYGVRKYIANSKTAEARNALGQISKDAATAYEKESMTINSVIAQGSASATLRQLCSSSTPVPSTGVAPRGSKYQAWPGDWNADSATPGKGFACLKYSMDQPQYYAYTYATVGSAAQGDSFNATALGDLNGDSNPSTFSVVGSIGAGMV